MLVCCVGLTLLTPLRGLRRCCPRVDGHSYNPNDFHEDDENSASSHYMVSRILFTFEPSGHVEK